MSDQFTEWINREFLRWEASRGKRMSMTEFAKHLGVPQPSLSNWMAGTHKPDGKNIHKLAISLGDEIYKIFGIKRMCVIEDADLHEVVKMWEGLSMKKKKAIMDMVRQK